MHVSIDEYEMKLPCGCVDLSAEEAEYDGGFLWIPICAAIPAACTVIGMGITIANKAGLVSNDIALAVKVGAATIGTVTGVASEAGLLLTMTAATSTAKLAMVTSGLTLEPGLNIATSGILGYKQFSIFIVIVWGRIKKHGR